MDKVIKEFFRNNDAVVGEGKDYQVNPPLYHSSLHLGFYHYFKTFQNRKELLATVIDNKNWTRDNIAFNFADHTYDIIHSILSFHRFIELYLKDVLRRIDPLLAVRFPDNAKETVMYLDKNLDAEELRTVEYAETYKRVLEAFNYYRGRPEIYDKYIQPLIFLTSQDTKDAFEVLTSWRNRIMHNGTSYPNIFSFDYLISKMLLPVLDKIIKMEKSINPQLLIPFYFQTKSGINVIDEILSADLSIEKMKSHPKEYALQILKLGHLKELGRCSFNHVPKLRRNIAVNESYYENPVGRAKRFAEAEIKSGYFHSIHNCLCCGEKTLIVYKRINKKLYDSEPNFFCWLRCFLCDYNLSDTVGDPSRFGITKKRYFPKKNASK